MRAPAPAARGLTYAGVFLISMATLMFELVLTRIFSVTLWYHFSFVAISLAMFGMTVGAVVVHVLPNVFSPPRVRWQMAVSCVLFAVGVLVCFHVHLLMPVPPALTAAALPKLSVTYALAAVPFLVSGVAISLAVTRFPNHVPRVYAADLIGAAIGCLVLGFVLEISDGTTAVYAVAAIAMAAAILLALDAHSRQLAGAATVLIVGLLGFIIANLFAISAHNGMGLFPITWTKGKAEWAGHYEHWNSYSRVKIVGSPEPQKPKGWGFSADYPYQWTSSWLALVIDASADTPLTLFDGNLDAHQYLRWDVTNIAHAVQRDADFAVVGSGGGRDLLSALVFGQKSVTGIEMNSTICDVMRNGSFADFTGHLDRRPGVTLVNAEARSYLTRTPSRFDAIQLSLVDTWAATAAGAFVFSENTLYTIEAWQTFFERLRPGGLMTVSRWYIPSDVEVNRLVLLARSALASRGATDPRRHLALIVDSPPARLKTGEDGKQYGVATLLAGRDPFTEEQIARLRVACHERGFYILLDPDPATASATDTTPHAALLAAIATNGESAALGLTTPNDDRPFFFNTTQAQDLLSPSWWMHSLLGSLLLFVIGLSAVFIVVPLWLTSAGESTDGGGARFGHPFLSLSTYFTCIGIGFMLVEIAQMQRLVVLVGHPAYSLTVVLFSLLIFSGLGSWTCPADTSPQVARRRLMLLVVMAVLTALATPWLVRTFQASTDPVRLIVGAATLCPIGLCMGMAFPLGMQWAQRHRATYTAWLWGVNGAASVCASILAMIISVALGITAAWIGGIIAYVAALAVYARAHRQKAEPAADYTSMVGAKSLT